MKEHGIDHIDFLKLDVEGAEYLVLDGFKKAIEGDKIDMVQFEYGEINASTHNLLRDFHMFFTGKGYQIGKLLNNRVRFKTQYSYADENFLAANYIACKSSRSDIIRGICSF